MKISAVWDAENICHVHRTRFPFAHLQQDYPQHEFELSLVDISPDVNVIWLYGAYRLDNLIHIMKLKRQGVKVVMGLDDNYWDFPAWRADTPSDETVATIELLASVADQIVVTTKGLAKGIGHLEKTIVAPNLLEVSAYRTPTTPDSDDIIRILWAGASGHKGDLSVADEACCEILKRANSGHYGKRVEFVFVGYAPDKVMRDYWNNGVSYIKWVPLNEYWYTLNGIHPHIVIAPLLDCGFNRAKSAIRVQEAWALNAACAYSPVGEYKAVSTDKVNGLCCNSTEEWIDNIDKLIKDKELRTLLTTNGYKTVKEEWNWKSANSRKKWHPTIDKILENQNLIDQPQPF